MYRVTQRAVWMGAVLGVLACAPPPPPPSPPPPPPGFSGEAAWQHLEALVEIGPRVPGSPGADAAAAYLRSSLEDLGLDVNEQTETFQGEGDAEPLVVRNVVVDVPGDSSDLILLVAHYDTTRFETFRFVGANEASGAAVLLELARVLSEEPLPYTVRLAFTGGDAPQGDGEAVAGFWGSYALLKSLMESGDLDRLRLAVFVDQVGDADLRVARDLRSQRTARDAFFHAAEELGVADAFPLGAGFDSVATGHVLFFQQGFRRIVALQDPRYGGEEPPGAYWHTDEDTLEHCSAQSLGTAGSVVLRGLRDVSDLFARVDRFVTPRAAASPETVETSGTPAPETVGTPAPPAPGTAPDARSEKTAQPPPGGSP